MVSGFRSGLVWGVSATPGGSAALARRNLHFSLKQLATAVAQAGRDAATKGDTTQTRKCFTALKQCGTALSSPDTSSLVQLVGKALINMADTELAKTGK